MSLHKKTEHWHLLHRLLIFITVFDDTPSEQLSLSTDTSVVMDADDLPQLQANESDDSF